MVFQLAICHCTKCHYTVLAREAGDSCPECGTLYGTPIPDDFDYEKSTCKVCRSNYLKLQNPTAEQAAPQD
jgi:hypothetical protein